MHDSSNIANSLMDMTSFIDSTQMVLNFNSSGGNYYKRNLVDFIFNKDIAEIYLIFIIHKKNGKIINGESVKYYPPLIKGSPSRFNDAFEQTSPSYIMVPKYKHCVRISKIDTCFHADNQAYYVVKTADDYLAFWNKNYVDVLLNDDDRRNKFMGLIEEKYHKDRITFYYGLLVIDK